MCFRFKDTRFSNGMNTHGYVGNFKGDKMNISAGKEYISQHTDHVYRGNCGWNDFFIGLLDALGKPEETEERQNYTIKCPTCSSDITTSCRPEKPKDIDFMIEEFAFKFSREFIKNKLNPYFGIEYWYKWLKDDLEIMF